MIEAVIFDMDGVLIESEPYHIRAEIAVFKKHGISLTDEIASEYLGFKLDDYITALGKRFRKDIDHQAISAELHKRIEIMYEEEVPLVPHVKELLPVLNESYKLALVTSREKHLALAVLNRLGIANFFSTGVYREDVQYGKPHPEGFLTAAKLLEVAPINCAVIEDAQAGIEASKQAGMYVIARKAAHNRNQNFSLADEVVEDLSILPGLLAS